MLQRISAIAGLLALLVTPVACSESQADKPVDQILNEARTVAKDAQSVHITGDLSQGPSKGTVDLLLTNGGDGKEEITTDGRTISLIKVGDTLHVKGLPGLPGPGYQTLSVKDPQASQLAQAVDKNLLLDQLLSSKQKLVKAGTGKVGETEAVKLKTQQGPGMLYIADDAEHPYPLKIDSTSPEGSLTIVFLDWDKETTITAPQRG